MAEFQWEGGETGEPLDTIEEYMSESFKDILPSARERRMKREILNLCLQVGIAV